MGIFMICAQAIIHFRPDGSYEKYLRMLVSVMILVQVFLPVANLFSAGMQQSIEERIAGMERQIQDSMDEAEAAAGSMDSILDRMTLEEVRERVQQQKQEERQKEATQENTGADGIGQGNAVLEGSGQGSAGTEGSAQKNAVLEGSGQEDTEMQSTAQPEVSSRIEIEKVQIEVGG